MAVAAAVVAFTTAATALQMCLIQQELQQGPWGWQQCRVLVCMVMPLHMLLRRCCSWHVWRSTGRRCWAGEVCRQTESLIRRGCGAMHLAGLCEKKCSANQNVQTNTLPPCTVPKNVLPMLPAYQA